MVNLKLNLGTSLFILLVSFYVVEGLYCDDDAHCCGNGFKFNGTCSECCSSRLDKTLGLVLGGAVSVVIVVTVTVIAACCFYPGCLGERNSRPTAAILRPQKIVFPAQLNPGSSHTATYEGHVNLTPTQQEQLIPSSSRHDSHNEASSSTLH